MLTGFAMLVGSGEIAFGQGPCSVVVIKDSPPESIDVLFPFEIDRDGNEPFLIDINGGDSYGDSFGSEITVTELPLADWDLVDIVCESTGATGFEITENGFRAGCDGGGSVTCTFRNVSAFRNIPAVSEWGMIAAAAGLGLIGLFFALRRKGAAV